MKRGSIWYGVIFFVCCFTMLSILGNESRGSETDCPPRKFEQHIQKILQLSSEQVEQLRILRCENRDDMRAARITLQEAKKQFRQKVKSLSGEIAVRKAFQPVARAMEDLAVYKTAMMQHMATILTEDQAEKMEALYQYDQFRHGDHPEESPAEQD